MSRVGLSSCIRCQSSEKGVVLVVVLVLSAVALAIMTALIYMITAGTQISGLQKRYKTALEAGVGGGDVFYQLIALRAETAATNVFTDNLNANNLNSSITTPASCSGLASGATYSGLAAKLLTPSNSWSGCGDTSSLIDPAVPSTYDMKLDLGTTTKYTVYAKIVATTAGNSGGDSEGGDALMNRGVVAGNAQVAVTPVPYLYAIEVEAENSANRTERANLSILYQY